MSCLLADNGNMHILQMLHSKFLSTNHGYITHSHMRCHGYIKESGKCVVPPLKQLSWMNPRADFVVYHCVQGELLGFFLTTTLAPFNWGRWAWSWHLSVWCNTKVKEFLVYSCHPIGLFITVNSCCYCHRGKLLQHFTIGFPNESSHIATGSLKQMLLSHVCGTSKASQIAHVWLWHQNV